MADLFRLGFHGGGFALQRSTRARTAGGAGTGTSRFSLEGRVRTPRQHDRYSAVLHRRSRRGGGGCGLAHRDPDQWQGAGHHQPVPLDNTGNIKLYSVEVTADAPGLQRYLSSVLQGEKIDVIASGNVVTLTGTVRDASVASRAVEIAKGSGATIVDNLTTPEAVQVLLKVRFAEVNKSAIKGFRSQLATLNPQDLNSRTGNWVGSANTDPKTGSFSDGVDGPGPVQREREHRAAHSRALFQGDAEEPS